MLIHDKRDVAVKKIKKKKKFKRLQDVWFKVEAFMEFKRM